MLIIYFCYFFLSFYCALTLPEFRLERLDTNKLRRAQVSYRFNILSQSYAIAILSQSGWLPIVGVQATDCLYYTKALEVT